MAELPGGSQPSSSQFWVDPTGAIWMYVNNTLRFRQITGPGGGLVVEPYATYTQLEADPNKTDGIKNVAVDDSENGDGSQSLFLTVNGEDFYLVTVKQTE